MIGRMAYAQTPNHTLPEETPEVQMENLQEDYLQGWLSLVNHPVTINKMDASDWGRLFFLNRQEKQAIKHHLDSFGEFNSKYELQAIQGLTIEKAKLLAEVIDIGSAQKFQFKKKVLKELKHELLVQTEINNQPKQENELGNSMRQLIWYKTNLPGKLQAGLILERDKGEPSNRPDYTGFYLQYVGKGFLKKMVLGNFHAVLAEGLTFATRAPVSKTSLVLQTQSFINGMSAHKTSMENGFVQGLGIVAGNKKTNLTLCLGSFFRVEPSVYSTVNLQNSKGNNRIPVYAFAISRRIKNLSFELILRNENWGLATKSRFGNMLFAGELSFTKDRFSAFRGEVLKPINKHWDVIINYRYYALQEKDPLRNGWSAYAGTANEKGLYIGSIYKINKYKQWGLFIDHYSSLKSRFGSPLGEKTSEIFLDYTASFAGLWQLTLRGIWTHAISGKVNQIVVEQEQVSLGKFRAQMQANIDKQTRITLGLAFQKLKEDVGFGLFGQAKRKGRKLDWQAGYVVFSSSNGNLRPFFVEADVPYQYNLKGYSDNGYCLWTLASKHISKSISLNSKLRYLQSIDLKETKMVALRELEFRIQLLCKW